MDVEQEMTTFPSAGSALLPGCGCCPSVRTPAMKPNPPKTGSWPQGTPNFSCLLLVALSVALMVVPSGADDRANASVLPAPVVEDIRVYVIDFNNLDVAAGTVDTDFYVTLRSDAPLSMDDFEIMNGQVISVETISDDPHEREYRILATVSFDPDLRYYPFDSHTMPIIVEPRIMDETELVLVINQTKSGLGPEVNIPGWEITGTRFFPANQSYTSKDVHYSRAVFGYSIERNFASTLLKFFLPLILIIIVSLVSLTIKASPRLLLNASMFLGAILIHWYLTAAIPMVAYATFLDLFMIITYTTLVMVLLSGILILKYSESNEPARVNRVYRWSIWIIPPASLVLFALLFLTFFG